MEESETEDGVPITLGGSTDDEVDVVDEGLCLEAVVLDVIMVLSSSSEVVEVAVG